VGTVYFTLLKLTVRLPPSVFARTDAVGGYISLALLAWKVYVTYYVVKTSLWF